MSKEEVTEITATVPETRGAVELPPNDLIRGRITYRY